MNDSRPRIDATAATGSAQACLRGWWTAGQFGLAGVVASALRELADVPAGSAWDLREAHLDHIGAQLLWNHWGCQWPAQVQASAGQRAMMERVERFTQPMPVPAARTWADRFDDIGAKVLVVESHVRGFVRLLGQLAINLGRLARAPSQGPWRDVSGHLYRIGGSALPITALVGFLIGVVLAYLMSQQLQQFGADAFIVDILGVSLIRELGPMLAAILIAGRSGSAITAQIGVMRVTEELDAMRVMGISQGYRLVMPRAIALALAMPLISVWTTLAALMGGMLSADLVMGVTPQFFFNAMPQAVSISNLYLALSKSVVFGVLIALVGCHFGLRVKPDTQSLGEGTTASVVTAITAVILVDALFAVLFSDVGI